MRLIVLGLFVSVVAGSLPAWAWDAELTLTRGAERVMTVYGHAAPPPGFIQLCRTDANECRVNDDRTKTSLPVRLTAQRKQELESVNSLVNMMIRPVSDLELYGEREFWTYPLKEGDCEDYVLLKRRMLISRGWPASSLLITVVRDEVGEGHAVLTAVTDHGDLILDNKQSAIKSWADTPYQYIKRQSPHDPLIWVTLAPSPPSAENYAGVSAGGSKGK